MRICWTFAQRGILAMTHTWGTEDQADFAYHNGNVQPQGFGHLCFAVPDLAKAMAWFDSNAAEDAKRPEQGKMKDAVFVKGPDGYWIESVQPALNANLGR